MTSRLLAVGLGLLVGVACSSSSSKGGGQPGGGDAGGSSGSDASGSSGSSSGTASSSGSSSSGSGGDGGGTSSACVDASAAFTSSDPEGQWSDGGYFLRNDAWNSDAGPQTMYACSYSSWNVVANEPSTTDVKTYPDVQKDFQQSGASDGSGVPISSYTAVTSTFAETSPQVGIYEVAYDIFVNSTTLVGPGTTEIMIWVDNYKQVPAGNKVDTAVPLDGRNYDVYYEADNGNGGHYVAFEANTNFTSGTVDVLAFFGYAVQKGWIPAAAPLNQIGFGVEICETNGADATFQFTDFSISAN